MILSPFPWHKTLHFLFNHFMQPEGVLSWWNNPLFAASMAGANLPTLTMQKLAAP